MIGKLIWSLLRDKPTIANVTKLMNQSLDLVLGSNKFGEERWAVKVFQKKPELRGHLTGRIEREIEFVLGQPNIYKAFRELLINTIKVSVVNDLIVGKFYDQRDLICSSIRRGMKSIEGNEKLQQGMQLVYPYEGYPDSEWEHAKFVHESAWAELKLIVLRQLQISIFEIVPGGQEKDWWDIYREAYEHYISEFYELVINSGEDHKGFPHPMLVAMGNENLLAMENTLLNSAKKP